MDLWLRRALDFHPADGRALHGRVGRRLEAAKALLHSHHKARGHDPVRDRRADGQEDTETVQPGQGLRDRQSQWGGAPETRGSQSGTRSTNEGQDRKKHLVTLHGLV